MMLSRRTLLASIGAGPWPAHAETYRRLVVPLAAAPAGLIPGLNDQPECRLVGTKLYHGLVAFSPALQPALAAAWTVSPDGLTYTFALQPGVVWHDGAPFTADDVVFSLDRFHRMLSPRLGPLLAQVASVQAAGPLSVTATLRAPLPQFLSRLDAASAPIVPRHIHDRPGLAPDPQPSQAIGTGPFQLQPGLRLTRFDAFTGLAPGLDEIVFPVLPDPAARLAATQTGQPVLLAADAVPLGALPRLRQQGMRVGGEAVPNHAAVAWLSVNGSVAPLADERVRLALAGAIDRAAILRDVWAGLGQVADGDRQPGYDPRAAASHLDAAGLHPDDQGIRLRLRYLVQAADPWPHLAAALQAMLGQVGIDVALEQVDPAEWARRVAALEYEATGMVHEAEPAALLDTAAEQRPATAAARVVLVEPYVPFAADRRLRMPGGVYSSFADATLTG